MHPTLKILSTIIAAIVLAVGGTMCLFKPAKVQEWDKERFATSGAFRRALLSHVVKPWYPIYLRSVGILLLLMAILFFYAAYSSR